MLGRPRCCLLAAALGVASLAWFGAAPASAATLLRGVLRWTRA
ncbi:hypothetical protein [Micromonospora sp. DT47]